MQLPFRFLLSLGWLALAGTASLAQGTDPLKSAACGSALQQLESARSGGSAAQVEGLRRQAAATCLGTASLPARPGRVLQAPVAVPPPVIEPPPRPPVLAAPTPIPPPVAIDRPATVTACDPGGCWVNSAGRLQHVAPNLMGPNGLCTSAAGTLHCP